MNYYKLYENGINANFGKDIILKWNLFDNYRQYEGDVTYNINHFVLRDSKNKKYEILIPFNNENKNKIEEILYSKIIKNKS